MLPFFLKEFHKADWSHTSVSVPNCFPKVGNLSRTKSDSVAPLFENHLDATSRVPLFSQYYLVPIDLNPKKWKRTTK